MPQGFDFFGRINSFLETFGLGGATVMIVVAFLFISLALWRGTGFVLFLLVLSFMFGTIQRGGMVFAITLMRWFCLALLAVACVRRFQFPNATMLFFVFYAVLGLAFAFFSPGPLWSLQKGTLKLVIAVFLPIAATTYFLSTDDIVRFFKMCIFAAAVWTLVSLILAREFVQAREMRFGFGARQQGSAVDAGSYLAPIIVWGIVQSRRRALRVFCSVLFVPVLLLLIISGKRAALGGQVIIASAPLLLLRANVRKTILLLIVGLILVTTSVFALFQFFPAKAQYLIDRFFSTGLTGREMLWAHGLRSCLKNPILGHGEGAADIAGLIGHGFHNSYLMVWYNTGVFGLLAVVSFLVIYMVKAWRRFRQARTEEVADFARVALGYLLGVIASGFFTGRLGALANINNCLLLIMCVLVDRLTFIEAPKPAYHQRVDEQPLLARYGVQAWSYYQAAR